MKKPKIYIVGKVSGEKETDCVIKFDQAANDIQKHGFIAINPIEVVNDWKCPWRKAVRLCIAEMMKADAVFMLKDWTKSDGAKIEYITAAGIGIPVFEQIENLQKHFGRYDEFDCPHPCSHIKLISAQCGCETTVQVCDWCGKYLTAPETDC